MLLYLLLIFTILAFVISFSFFKKQKKNNQTKQITFKTNSDLYDKEYAEMYDTVIYDYYRRQKEINTVVAATFPDSIVLDLGSGTGHLVHELNQKGIQTIGIDNSYDMIRYSKKYPHRYLEKDMLEMESFSPNSFTHVTCFYYTLYYIKNKDQVFRNVYHWLTPGGLFILQLTTTCNYGKSAVQDSKYMYKRKIKDNNVYETITRGKNIRKNEHVFYIEPIPDIVNIAQQSGFIVVSSEQYKDNVFYIFKKTE
uniref:Methyltransferase domain-containing protein n=1 Tax=viral metagenome TaxID=1070528 RepID=A0A6C0B8M1_9ZZZZ